jgi:LysR family glycine cleavage system transcriptional activator
LEIDLRLDASNRMVDLITEDFAIRYSKPSPEKYDEIKLFGDFVLPVCTSEFVNQYRLSNRRNSLEEVPLIHLGERTPDPHWADWTIWGKAFGFQQDSLQEEIRLTQFNSGIQTAIRGQGLVLCGIIEAYNAIKRGALIMPFGPKLNCPTSYEYRLISVHGRNLTKFQIQFQNWIVDTAKAFHAELSDSFSTTWKT